MESVLSRTQEMMVNFWKFFPSNRKRTGFIVLLILAAAVPLTVLIAQKQQETRQRASEASRIEITGANVANGTATSRNVKLRLTYVPVVSPTEAPTVAPSVSPEVTISTTVTPETTLTVSPSETPPTATSVPPTATTAPSPTITPTGQPVQTSPTTTQYGPNCQALHAKIVESMNKSCDQPGYDPVADVNTTKDRVINQRDLDIFNSRSRYPTAEQWCQDALGSTTSPCVQGVATAQEASTTVQFRASNDQNTLEQAQVQSFAPEELASSPITKEIDWTLTEGNGQKTIFAQFKFGDAAWESVLSTTVNLSESSTLSPTVSMSPSSTSTAPLFLEDTSKLKILVVLVKASDDDNPLVYGDDGRPQDIPLTREYIRNIWFGISPDARSVSNYFRENSQGRLLLNENNVDIRDYVTIPYPKVNCQGMLPDLYMSQPIRQWQDAAASAIVARDSINLNDYTFVVYQMVSWPACIGGETGANMSIRLSVTNLHSLVHEIGHIFGLGHAADMYCKDRKQIADIARQQMYANWFSSLSPCILQDSADDSSIMGYDTGGVINFNAPERDLLGWIPQDKIRDITTTTLNITIYPLGSSQGPQVLKIPKRSGVITLDSRGFYGKRYSSIQNYYYVSYRRPIGYDADLQSQNTIGSSLHLMTIYKLINPTPKGLRSEEQSILINMEPGTDAIPAFQDGTVFRDDIDDLTITQNAHDDNSATLSIQFTVSAEPTSTSTPTPQPTTTACGCADINGNDGVVTILDYSLLVSPDCWNKSKVQNPNDWTNNFCSSRDINGDSALTILDYSCLASQWQQSCRR